MFHVVIYIYVYNSLVLQSQLKNRSSLCYVLHIDFEQHSATIVSYVGLIHTVYMYILVYIIIFIISYVITVMFTIYMCSKSQSAVSVSTVHSVVPPKLFCESSNKIDVLFYLEYTCYVYNENFDIPSSTLIKWVTRSTRKKALKNTFSKHPFN